MLSNVQIAANLHYWFIKHNYVQNVIIKEKMSYLKGKDIKIPFDCLWYYFTRKYEQTGHNHLVNIKPKDFNKW